MEDTFEYLLRDFQNYVVGARNRNKCNYDIAKTLMLKIADYFIEEHGNDPVGVADSFGFEVRYRDSEFLSKGTIIPTDGFKNLLIHVKKNPDPNEELVTIGHELGHSLFFNKSSGVYKRIMATPSPIDANPVVDEERLCEDFAYYLLGLEGEVERVDGSFVFNEKSN